MMIFIKHTADKQTGLFIKSTRVTSNLKNRKCLVIPNGVSIKGGHVQLCSQTLMLCLLNY